MLIGDDTGSEKGGSCSAGMQRQYAGTAGKITNCQLGAFLAHASAKGRARIVRELYLPRSWTGDQERPAAAKVPEGTAFATKLQLLLFAGAEGHLGAVAGDAEVGVLNLDGDDLPGVGRADTEPLGCS